MNHAIYTRWAKAQGHRDFTLRYSHCQQPRDASAVPDGDAQSSDVGESAADEAPDEVDADGFGDASEGSDVTKAEYSCRPACEWHSRGIIPVASNSEEMHCSNQVGLGAEGDFSGNFETRQTIQEPLSTESGPGRPGEDEQDATLVEYATRLLREQGALEERGEVADGESDEDVVKCRTFPADEENAGKERLPPAGDEGHRRGALHSEHIQSPAEPLPSQLPASGSGEASALASRWDWDGDSA
jgi:hypothetical protein